MLDDFTDQGFVELQFGGDIIGAMEMQRGINLAAFKGLTDPCTQFRLNVPEAFRQSEAGFEVAMIHRADFSQECAAFQFQVCPGEARHAVNHLFFLVLLGFPAMHGQIVRIGWRERLTCYPQDVNWLVGVAANSYGRIRKAFAVGRGFCHWSIVSRQRVSHQHRRE